MRCGAARGAAPVGRLADLPEFETATVLLFRFWSPERRVDHVPASIRAVFGPSMLAEVAQSSDQLFQLLAANGRRPLARHAIGCGCLGADESAVSHFVAAATARAQDDATLFATLLLRPDVTGLGTALAAAFGDAVQRALAPASPRQGAIQPMQSTQIH